MSQRESRLSRKILNHLRIKGCFCFKVWGSEHMMSGLPDIIGCHQGRFFGFEVKTPDNRDGTSARQRYIIGVIKGAGGIAEVVCSPDEAWAILSEQVTE